MIESSLINKSKQMNRVFSLKISKYIATNPMDMDAIVNSLLKLERRRFPDEENLR